MIHLLPIFGNKATEIVVYYSGPSVGDDKSLLRVIVETYIIFFYIYIIEDLSVKHRSLRGVLYWDIVRFWQSDWWIERVRTCIRAAGRNALNSTYEIRDRSLLEFPTLITLLRCVIE